MQGTQGLQLVIRVVLDPGVILSTISPFNSSIWLGLKLAELNGD